MSVERARKVADAVLYEGYVLYPYRASAAKNQVRWQFGVVAPRPADPGESSDPWAMQTECLIDPGDAPAVDLTLRFLQLQARTPEAASGAGFEPVEALEAGGETVVAWDEGVERSVDCPPIPLREIAAAERAVPVDIPGGVDVERLRGADGEVAGRIIRQRWPITAVIRISAQPVGSAFRLRARIENLALWPGEAAPGRTARDAAMRRALLGAHTVLSVRDGLFVSLLEPPEWARAAAAACQNVGTWPVLIGDAGSRDVMLSSPIILYDYPEVAPESPGDLCDATEIDEILTLRIMTLTDEEKREARGTDERARRIIERSESIPADVFERMHGVIRYLRAPGAGAPESVETAAERAKWDFSLDPQADARPEEAWVQVAGARVRKGTRVTLRPCRRADAIDPFLAGRTARVEGVYRDVDDEAYVAVTLDGDPAAELHRWHGRFFYFYPEEIEPMELTT